MITINDILKALECCSGYDPKCEDCPYRGIGMCESVIKEDALEYLKTIETTENLYHDAVNELSKWKDEDWKDRYLPLTWDELKQMKGKPVWVESHGDITEFTGWCIVSEALSDRARFILSHYDDDNDFLTYEMSLPNVTFGRDWQVYKKERT